MNRLESHRDFEPPRDLAARTRASCGPIVLACDSTVTAANDAASARNSGTILRRHGPLVEEVARVVELESIRRPDRRAPGGRRSSCRGQRTRRRWTIDRPSPQIAERARERTLGAGEKDRERPLDRSVRPALFLEQGAVRRVRIYVRPSADEGSESADPSPARSHDAPRAASRNGGGSALRSAGRGGRPDWPRPSRAGSGAWERPASRGRAPSERRARRSRP